jgi:four helix bundle protein
MDDNGEIKSYRDLKVWQKSMDAADLVMDLIDAGPLSKKYRLAGQWEASSASVPANISEGHELGTRKQYLAHLYHARGSLAETLTYLELFERRKLIETERARALWGMLIEVRKMLYKLISRLEEGSGEDSGNDATNPVS